MPTPAEAAYPFQVRKRARLSVSLHILHGVVSAGAIEEHAVAVCQGQDALIVAIIEKRDAEIVLSEGQRCAAFTCLAWAYDETVEACTVTSGF